MSRRGKKRGLSAQARQSLRERRRAARKKAKVVASPQERLRIVSQAAGGFFIVPKGVGLRDLLADDSHKYPPDMPYGDLVRAFANYSATAPGNQDYSAWDVLEGYPYRYPPEWDNYPPTPQEVRVLAQAERLRCEALIPIEWTSCEPNDDDSDELRARMQALYDLEKEVETPLPAGERRAAGQYW